MSALKSVRGWVCALLLGVFLWMGVPRCAPVDGLSGEERQRVERLCREVRASYFFEPDAGRLSAAEWRAVLAAHREAETRQFATLDRDPAAFADLTGPVVRRLAERLR